MSRISRKKLSTTVYITADQDEELRLLHKTTKVPIAEYIRQGIDLLLLRHRAELPGQQQSLFEELEQGGANGCQVRPVADV